MWDVCSEYHLCLDWMEYYAKRASELLDKHPNFRLHVHRSSSSLTGNMPSNVHDLCGCAGHEKSNSCMFFHDPLRTVKIVKHVTTLKTMLDQDKRFFEQVADFAWQAKRTVNERVLHDRDAFESVDAPIDRNMLDPGASPEENFLLASQRQNRMTNEKYAGNRFSNSMEKTLAPRNRTRNFTQFEDARTWCTAWFGVPSNYVLAVLADPVARPSELFDMVSWANLAEMRKIAKAWQRTGFSTHDLETYINEAAAKRNYIDDSSQQNFCKCMDLFKDRIEASSNQAHVELLHSHRKLFFDAFVKYVYYTKLQLGGPGPDRIRCPILEARVSLDTFSDHATQHRTAILDDLPAMAYEGNGPDTAPLPSPPNATDFIDNAPEHLLQTEGGFEFDSSNLDAGRDGNYAGAPENFYSTDGSEQLFATPDQLFHDDIQDIPVTLRPWDPIGGELSDDVWSQPRTVH